MLRPLPLALIFAASPIVTATSAFASPGFYDPPTDLPGSNGAIVRSEPMKLAVTPGRATRIMYRSTDTAGAPVAVTGVHIEPTKPTAGGRPRPLVTFAPGTQGQADGCAPSYGLERGYLSRVQGVTNFGYELPGIGALVRAGAAVVVTDYVGLGTTDRLHTYVNRVDQGHAVLDAARAAQHVPGASVTAESPVGVFGYSQGGGASGAAAELAATYAPELRLKAAYVGGPPADLFSVMQAVDGTALTGVIGYAVNGLAQTYPELRPIVEEQANARGKAALAKLARQCEPDSMASFGFQKTSRWTNDGRALWQIVASTPAISALVDAQKIGRVKPSVPVRVLTATRDDIVPHAQARQLAVDWCALGATVDYVPVRQSRSTGGTGFNHIGPIFSHGPAAQRWLLGQMSGQPEMSNCEALPDLP